MKKFLLCLALAGFTAACKSTAGVADTSGEPSEPKADCCSEMNASECSGEMKAECSTEAKTCPVTGKTIN